MRRTVLCTALGTWCAAGAGGPRRAGAQSGPPASPAMGEAAGVAWALAGSLRAAPVRGVLGGPADGLAHALARALGVPLVGPAVRRAPPPCGWAPAAAGRPRGYYADVRRSERGPATPARVRITVTLSCDNPPGYLHDVFARWQEYVVGRAGGRWRVVGLVTLGVT